jgi:hypothetical protein
VLPTEGPFERDSRGKTGAKYGEGLRAAVLFKYSSSEAHCDWYLVDCETG